MDQNESNFKYGPKVNFSLKQNITTPKSNTTLQGLPAINDITHDHNEHQFIIDGKETTVVDR